VGDRERCHKDSTALATKRASVVVRGAVGLAGTSRQGPHRLQPAQLAWLGGLTITLVKSSPCSCTLALFFLGLALIVAFVVAQAVVVARNLPRPLFDFVAGVLRWQARVYGFAFSLTDVYPPFTLKPAPHYPVDLEIVYPKRSNPWLASFTVAALIFWLAVVLPLGWGGYSSPPLQLLDWLTNVRIFVLLPHYLVLFFFFLAALVVLAVGQVLILIGGYFLPACMPSWQAGCAGWCARGRGSTASSTPTPPSPLRIPSSTVRLESGREYAACSRGSCPAQQEGPGSRPRGPRAPASKETPYGQARTDHRNARGGSGRGRLPREGAHRLP
jgi:hypothetical protein